MFRKAQLGTWELYGLWNFCESWNAGSHVQWRPAPKQVIELDTNVNGWMKVDLPQHGSLMQSLMQLIFLGLRSWQKKTALKQFHSSLFPLRACKIWVHTLQLIFSIAWQWVAVHQSIFLWDCDQKHKEKQSKKKKFNEMIYMKTWVRCTSPILWLPTLVLSSEEIDKLSDSLLVCGSHLSSEI